MTDKKEIIEAGNNTVATAQSGHGQFSNLIIELARDPKFDAEKLRVMYDMDKEDKARYAKESFDAAIIQFQNDVPRILKTAKSNNGKYAKLDNIMAVIRPHMQANGLLVRFKTGRVGDCTSVTCILSHTGGHSEESYWEGSIPSNNATNDAKTSGMAITYGQRYTLLPMLGIVAEDDNDANQVPVISFVSDEQIKELEQLLIDSGSSAIDLCKFYKIESIKSLTTADFENTKATLGAKIRAANNETS